MRLDAINIHKRYDRKPVFQGISLSLTVSESLAVTGSNGSGKSTLMKILAGLSAPTLGSVTMTLFDKSLEKTERFRYIGFVAPYLQFYEELTGLENIVFSLRAKNVTPEMSRLNQLFEHFALHAAKEKPVKMYSSGMAQRLRFIQALAAQPKFLFLDEPTVTLDQNGIAQLWSILDELRSNVVLIIASNDARDVGQCQRTLSIEDYKNS
jgi:heme exporter protein A